LDLLQYYRRIFQFTRIVTKWFTENKTIDIMGLVRPTFKQGTENQARAWLSHIVSDDVVEDYIDAMVDADIWLSAPIGLLQEEYDRINGIVECPDEGIKSYLMYCEAERLRNMYASLNGDYNSMSGMNLIIDGLDLTHFYTIDMYGHIFYFIFDEGCESDSSHIHSICDYISRNIELRESLEHMKFDHAEIGDKKDVNNDSSSIMSMDAYNVAVRYLRENQDEEISRLVGQYHYGKCVHEELENALSMRGIEYMKR
jgi:hypothetical protein